MDLTSKGLTVVILRWWEIVKSTVKSSPYFMQLKEKLAKFLILMCITKKQRGSSIIRMGSYWNLVLTCVQECFQKIIRSFLEVTQIINKSSDDQTFFLVACIKNFIKQAVRHCDICQRNKQKNLCTLQLLQPLPIPENIWEDISMDFIEGLPLMQDKSIIMVVVDRLTKFSHFYSIKHLFIVQQVAHILFI